MDLKEPALFESESGKLEYYYSEKNVWITSVHCTDSPYNYTKLYKQAFSFFQRVFPTHIIDLLIDPTNEKLLKHFCESELFQIEYVAFRFRKENV